MVIVDAMQRERRSAIPWLVHGFLLLVLLVAMVAVLVLSVQSAHAKTMQVQQSQQAVVVQNRWQFNRGWNDGYRDTVKACLIGKHQQLRAQAVQRARLRECLILSTMRMQEPACSACDCTKRS